jgi:hypothetical protein
MWKKAAMMLCFAAVASGCSNFLAPDGLLIDGMTERTVGGVCHVPMPDGVMGEKGSEPDLSACSGIDARITAGK